MSVSLDQVHDLSLALFAGYPVIAVAYYAARTAPDARATEPERPRLLPMPERWQHGIRRQLLEIVGRSAYNRDRFNFENNTARLDADFRLSRDTAILLWFVPGLAASVLAFLFGTDPDSSGAFPLAANQFRLEPLGPHHNQADNAAWMSSIEQIRSTPGYPDSNWPPRSGMTLEANLTDLRRHADDFTRGAGFTFTVLDPGDEDVIGCVYLYPSASAEWEVTVQSWVRADRSGLDVPLADAVARWLATDWPWERVDRCGR